MTFFIFLTDLVSVLVPTVVLGAGLLLLTGALRVRMLPASGADAQSPRAHPVGGVILCAIGLYFATEYGSPGLYGLWLNVRAPYHVWSASGDAGETSIGGPAAAARSFRAAYEIHAQGVLVRDEGNDLLIQAGKLEALQRKPWMESAKAKSVYARLSHGHVSTGPRRRGGTWSRLDLSKVADSPMVGLSVPLSNARPYASLGSASFRFRNAMRHCVKECYVGFVLELESASGERHEATTFGIQLRPR